MGRHENFRKPDHVKELAYRLFKEVMPDTDWEDSPANETTILQSIYLHLAEQMFEKRDEYIEILMKGENDGESGDDGDE